MRVSLLYTKYNIVQSRAYFWTIENYFSHFVQCIFTQCINAFMGKIMFTHSHVIPNMCDVLTVSFAIYFNCSCLCIIINVNGDQIKCYAE